MKRKIAIRLSFLGAALVIAILAVPYISGLQLFRDPLVSVISRSIGRQVEVKGISYLKLFPTVAFVLNDVTVSNAEWGEEPWFIKLNNVELKLATWPLLQGDIQVISLTLDEPDIRFEIGDKGQENWLLRSQSQPVSQDVSPEDDVSQELTTAFEQVKITDGQVHFRSPDQLMSLGFDGNASFKKQDGRPLLVTSLQAHDWTFKDLNENEDASQNSWVDVPLKESLAIFSKLDTKVDVALNSLVIEDLNIKDINLQLTANKGKISIEPIKAALAEGAFIGKMQLDQSKSPLPISLNGELKDLNVQKFLSDLDLTDKVVATGLGNLDVKSHGNTIRQMLVNAKGHLSMATGSGEVELPWAFLGADLTRLDRLAGTTKLNCFVWRFTLDRQMAMTDALLLDSNLVAITGKGHIGLGTGALDLNINPRPKETSLASIGAPLKIGGTLADPVITPNIGYAAKGVAQAALGGLINPLFILTPLMRLGEEEKNPCLDTASYTPPKEKNIIEEMVKEPVDVFGNTLKNLGEGIGKALGQ